MIDWDKYSALIPLVVAWLLEVESNILTEGRVLTALELEDARSVGVKKPESIRVLLVDTVAQPKHPVLLAVGKETNFLGESAAGRTVGYGIEIVNGKYSRRLLRHEFRHVFQFESASTRESFITDYIKSVLSEGYTNSIYEQDARAFEAH